MLRILRCRTEPFCTISARFCPTARISATSGLTPLHVAACHPNASVVRTMLGTDLSRANLRVRLRNDRNGMTVLQCAVLGAEVCVRRAEAVVADSDVAAAVQVIKTLLRPGAADLSVQSMLSVKALRTLPLADGVNDVEALAMFVQQGEDGDGEVGSFTVLQQAVLQNSAVVLQALLDGCTDVDPSLDDAANGGTLLHLAARHGCALAARVLCAHAKFTARVDALSVAQSATPLMLAAERGHLLVVQVLVSEANASLEFDDDVAGGNPILLARHNGFDNIATCVHEVWMCLFRGCQP